MKAIFLPVLLTACLVLTPILPAQAGVLVLSDEELGGVGARGFQTVSDNANRGQVYNAESVQTTGHTQQGASAMDMKSVSGSAVNIGQDINSFSLIEHVVSVSINAQFAKATSAPSWLTVNDRPTSDQVTNTGSVDVGGWTQKDATAMSMLNAADAAKNIYQNVAAMKGADGATLKVLSHQKAVNEGSQFQEIVNLDDVTGQVNNNASVRLADQAQKNARAMSISNVAAAAQNTSKPMGVIRDSKDLLVVQKNEQSARNSWVQGNQVVINEGETTAQTNNDGAVQAGGYAQAGAQAMVVDNVAASALNVGQNVLLGKNVEDARFIQRNEQKARNTIETYAQADDLLYLAGNEGSVVLSGNAQAGSKTMALANVATSAVNVGQNIASVKEAQGTIVVMQTNEQKAVNYAGEHAIQLSGSAQADAVSLAIVNASGAAANVGQNIASVSGPTGVDVILQKNKQVAKDYSFYSPVSQTTATTTDVVNKNLVGNNDTVSGPQAGVRALLLANVAGSAVNVGQNIARAQELVGFNIVGQSNEQRAVNEPATLDGIDTLFTVNYGAYNNDSGVQLVGEAQNGSKGMALVNAGESAVNVGQNVASVANLAAGGLVLQKNEQKARNIDLGTNQLPWLNAGLVAGETIENINNNNSVQAEGGQAGAAFMALTNTASSALNVGQNVMEGKSLGLVTAALQVNKQRATNYGDNNQVTDTSFFDGETAPLSFRQDNNMASVQMEDGAQKGASGLALANTAASALNVGQNLASISSVAGLNVAVQANKQKASNTENVYQNTHTTIWEDLTLAQNNNNGSVEFTSGALDDAKGLSISSMAVSSANIGQNLATVKEVQGLNAVVQVNKQKAELSATATQITENFEGGTLVLASDGQESPEKGQTNNNASVRFDGAGNGVTGGSVLNAAASAVNVGQNLAYIANGAGANLVLQVNRQKAESTTDLDQATVNGAGITRTNNLGSVQLIGSQNNASALSLANVANSAANIGQNLAAASGTVGLQVLAQVNKQTAKLDTVTTQVVVGEDGTGVKNNNSTLQLDGSQNNVSALSVLNAAGSAVNVGQNIASVKEAQGTIVVMQTNEQKAVNYAGEHAIQLSGSAQADAVSLAIVNASGAAANVGQNIASVSGPTGVDVILQKNKQVAKDYSFYSPVSQTTATTTDVVNKNLVGNNDTVSGPQAGVRALLLANVAGSAVNVGQNIARAQELVGFNIVGQSNEQRAVNEPATLDGIDTLFTVNYGAYNNDSGVQLVGEAQNGSKGMALVNAGESAVNVGQNVASVANLAAGGLVLQKNEQKARNIDLGTNQLPWLNAGLVAGETIENINNNNSVQAEGGQAGAAFMALTNTASSALNVGQNVMEGKSLGLVTAALQVNKQRATNYGDNNQVTDTSFFDGETAPLSFRQDNNMASVQMEDGAQKGASGLALANTAASALNVGQNLASISSVAGLNVAVQANKQKASNTENVYQNTHTTIWEDLTLAQNNNNGSVEFTSGALDDAKGLSISSMAVSSANIGQNLATVKEVQGLNAVVQVNKQKAELSATATQITENFEGGTLVLASDGQESPEKGQTNNNASVRFDGAGNGVTGGSVLNAAASAVNVGQNLAYIANGAGANLVLQVNRQKAESTTDLDQATVNGAGITRTNNLGSVQLIGSQNNASALSLANVANSAANIGQNLAAASGTVGLQVLAQVNKQTAKLDTVTTQVVVGEDGTGVKNNNSTLQLDGSQNNVSALSVLNAASSAVNVGQNIANLSRAVGTVVHQVNCQYAERDILAEQAVVGERGFGQNNNGSVLLTSSQAGGSGMWIMNVVGSAVNYGQNLAIVSGSSGVRVFQTNIGRAINN